MSNTIFQTLEKLPFRMKAVIVRFFKGNFMLKKENAVLVLIDVQGRLAELVDGSAAMLDSIRRLLEGMQTLEVPVVVTEQIPEKLGPTRDEFQPFLSGTSISKTAFSCCGEPMFCKAVDNLKRTQVILCGIETHVCVYQTALDLLEAGYEVSVVTDAVSSRDPANKALALRRLEVEGVSLTGTEMLLFELLADAQSPQFKSILHIIK
jgi:nicotinamidase-related amidase